MNAVNSVSLPSTYWNQPPCTRSLVIESSVPFLKLGMQTEKKENVTSTEEQSWLKHFAHCVTHSWKQMGEERPQVGGCDSVWYRSHVFGEAAEGVLAKRSPKEEIVEV